MTSSSCSPARKCGSRNWLTSSPPASSGIPPSPEIRAQKDWSPKDPYEVKRIPMLPEVEQVIRRRCSECRSGGEYVFKNSVGRKVHLNRSRERLQKLFPKVGINGDRRLHWHSFRNYFVILCLKKGVTVTAMVLHHARAMNREDAQAEFSKLFEDRGKSGAQEVQASKNP